MSTGWWSYRTGRTGVRDPVAAPNVRSCGCPTFVMRSVPVCRHPEATSHALRHLFETDPYSMGWTAAIQLGRPVALAASCHFYPPLLRSATVASSWLALNVGEAQRELTPEPRRSA